ncbi:helix-turn-helix transcriptional regulator [Fusibacter bizertensis]|uniref:Helix-turn-helix transcriptional regulator n=1 Tax=Fusibacter bizertensis TaxID=1488331 RepID=A0ABT6NE40_9FIRM|nr:helix-turn-helix transcriptional regulator [Fusibacter bizertensis]MDH8678672.1 helix-turn-helix transcriptional regulator [Fusibacter bizertensis]
MKNYLGTFIKSVRISKSITQRDLADNICTIRQLSRIESNTSSPSAFILQNFSTKLGTDLLKYLPYSSEANGYFIKNVIDDTYLFYNKHQYDNALIEINKIDSFHEISDKCILQEVLWLKASIRIHLDLSEIDISYFIDLLKLTKKIDTLNDIFKYSLTKVEFEIISSIIFLLLNKNDLTQSEWLLTRLIELSEVLFEDSNKSSYLRALHNLAKIKYINHDYKSTVDLAEKGISYCIKYNSLDQLDRLYNICGRAYYNLGDLIKGQQYLLLYIFLSQHRALGDQLTEIYNTLIKKYKLETFSFHKTE